MTRALDVAVLVKQVPVLDALELDDRGRLRRSGQLELNPYCRRAVTKGVELARATGGRAVVITLGPPAAEEVVREGVAAGATRGVLVTDPAFAGSDTLATARALAAVLEREGPFDLVLAGLSSVDADTGQVAPQVAELLDRPFAAGVRGLDLDGEVVVLHCERDDGVVDLEVRLPAVLAVAERLCDPAKFGPEARAEVLAERISVVTAADLGPGPWGEDASPTRVGPVRTVTSTRLGRTLTGSVADQVHRAVDLLAERSATGRTDRPPGPPPSPPRALRPASGPAVVVLVEPGRPRLAAELLGGGRRLADSISGPLVAATLAGDDVAVGGDDLRVAISGEDGGRPDEEDVAVAMAGWVGAHDVWAVLAPSTTWGRHVAGRVAAALGAGLTGDAIDLEVVEGRLVAWKPAFGGMVEAAITASSPVQMATIRPGVLAPGPAGPPTAPTELVVVPRRRRVRELRRAVDAAMDTLLALPVLVGVGQGVPPDRYHELEPLLDHFATEMVATRKVTDAGWLPRTRQVGMTGLHVAPDLYISIGLSGRPYHTIGIRNAGTVLAIDNRVDADIFTHADIGLVGDWAEVVPLLVASLRGAADGVPGGGERRAEEVTS